MPLDAIGREASLISSREAKFGRLNSNLRPNLLVGCRFLVPDV